jgi:WD40 repeat protein
METFCLQLLRITSRLCGTRILGSALVPLVGDQPETYNSACVTSSQFLAGPHGGAVWDCDPSWDSQYLVTACADANARLFEVNNGRYIARMPHKG